MAALLRGPNRRRLVMVISVVVLMLFGVGAGRWILRDNSDDGPVPSPTASTGAQREPSTGSAETASASATAMASGSPTSQSKSGPKAGSLQDLLRYAPDRLADDSLPLPFVASYADISGWMAMQGISKPTSLSDPNLARWERQLNALSLPTSLATRGTESLWKSTYGFDLTQVDQVLTVGQAPDYVIILKGAFDSTELQNAWSGSGYQAVKVEDTTVWSLFPQDRIDLSAPASRPALGSLNNMVLLEDGTLIAAAKLSLLQSALKVYNGDKSSLGENDDVQGLLSPSNMPGQLVSAIVAKGDLLETIAPKSKDGEGNGTNIPAVDETKSTPAASTPTTAAQMPEVKLVLIGLQRLDPAVGTATPASAATPAPAGGSSLAASPAVVPTMIARDARPGEMVMILLLRDDDDVDAAQRVMRDRLAGERSAVTGRLFASRLDVTSLNITADGAGTNMVLLRANLIDGPDDWVSIVETRDLGFAFWPQFP